MAETDLKTLKLKRRNLTASQKRLRQYLETHDSIDPAQLQSRKLKLEQMFEQFEEIQTQIEIQEEFNSQEEERDRFETEYHNLASMISSLTLKGNINSTNSSKIISSDNLGQIKLPTINLPTFTGEYEQWFPFFDTFQALIHVNDNISDVQKFQYLKSSLKGEAANILQSLEISASNYEDAWQMLIDRYDNKRLIVHKHIQALHELTPATKESHAHIRSLLDGMLKHVRALTALKRPTEHWDDLLIYLATTKLDHTTIKEWESQVPINEFPKFKALADFLARKCNTLETTSKASAKISSSPSKFLPPNKVSSYAITNHFTCVICSENHRIYRCNKFLESTTNQRTHQVKLKNLCFNCLQSNHSAAQCKAGTCKICHKRHHTLLHSEKQQPEIIPTHTPSTSITNHSVSVNLSTQTLLSTAIVMISDKMGRFHRCRALLDSGSQSHLITRELATKLGLPFDSTLISISGINQTASQVTQRVQVAIKSLNSGFQSKINCLILNTISERLPQVTFSRSNFHIPKNLNLADPEFHVSRSVDLLIGAELFFHLLCVGLIDMGKGQPILQKTLLGWIVSGNSSSTQSYALSSCNLSTMRSIDLQLSKFWELETIASTPALTPNEKICEENFMQTHTRNLEGRFVVTLPVKPNAPPLGNSRDQALRRLHALEKKLEKQPTLKFEYASFLREYLDLGHMKRLSRKEAARDDINHFYLPHHAVCKENSITTKVRVVFDGSAKSSTGPSLNDTLLVGPKLQQDLFDIVARFRTHQIAITADIAKMYRQVQIAPSQTPLQRILWRENVQDEVETFELTTVTYGTSSASYLAIKSLQQLALDEQKEYARGAKIILRDFYVDDLLTGANTLEDAKNIRDEVNAVLSKGGFELRKWSSNYASLLEDIPGSSSQNHVVNFEKSEGTNTLGLQWNVSKDILQYCVQPSKPSQKINKRLVLARTAQIFDPLGLIAPIIIVAKLFMQTLWELQLDWDESLPGNLQTKWTQYERELEDINHFQIPRNVMGTEKPIIIELHGFCDASEKAYGACLYLRVTDAKGNVTTNLLSSKSRVAPLKTISLPRLELCGALLLAQLSDKIRSYINLPFSKIRYWTDSSIVLSWLNASAKSWKTFVANRISEIQELTIVSDWQHVSTKDNSADILSRGARPIVLQDSSLWWTGPEWLREDMSRWPNQDKIFKSFEETPERKIVQISTAYVTEDTEFFSKFSNLNRLIRITAYCLRFKTNLQARMEKREDVQTGYLTNDDLNEATTTLLRIVQQQVFVTDILHLQKHGHMNAKSKLLPLNPFIDDKGLLRVGGRLRHSNVPYHQKHQILLPHKHPFSELVIRSEHLKHFHSGVQTTIAIIRNKYWLLNARNSVKAILRTCITCFKAKPFNTRQLMGDLPATRTMPARPFENVGVDYFGPLYLRDGKRRNSSTVKAYGAVFVCFATKAVHLELVGNLSTQAFLAALKRFMSRRGKVLNIYSDNGTQFIGARRELHDLKRLITSQDNIIKIQEFSSQENIKWHFIPARSPHFGGIWEAAVKSAKQHLTRVLGKTSLNYEEMNTMLVQIEAILNSRPLTPMSNDPNDLSFLTPSHFLIGDSMTSVPEPSLSHLKFNSLSRWQYIQQVREHFWKRWSKEYLSQLQPRNHWKLSSNEQLKTGDMVLLREDNLPPLQWSMGRVLEVFPGSDNVVRVADVRTSRGVLRRAVAKLYKIPIE